MLERLLGKESSSALMVGVQAGTAPLDISVMISKKRETSFLKTQEYLFWVYIQRVINHATSFCAQLCS